MDQDDLDNVVDLASRRKAGEQQDYDHDDVDGVVHTLVCLSLQSRIYEERLAAQATTVKTLKGLLVSGMVLALVWGCLLGYTYAMGDICGV